MIQEKINLIESELKQLDASQNSETKSSMGDKYETSREMMQRERDQLTSNLQNNKSLLQTLSSIDINKTNNDARLGSLIYTTTNVYFLAIGLGEIIVDAQKIWVISPSSPIGKLLLGKKEGETFEFNKSEVKITSLK